MEFSYRLIANFFAFTLPVIENSHHAAETSTIKIILFLIMKNKVILTAISVEMIYCFQ